MTAKVTIPNTFAGATTAIPLSQLDANFSNISSTINNALTYSNYATDTGTANNYLIAITGQTTTYVTGIAFQFKAANTNTGASTLNVNSQGSISIIKTDGSALVAGDIIAGGIVSVMYDGTNFQLLNDAGGAAGTFTNVSVTGTATINVANVTTFNPAITNAQLANSSVTIGNTAVSLGSTQTSFGNVTLTNATLSSLSAPVTVGQGGTGSTSLAAENVLIGNNTSELKVVAPGTTGNVLTSNGTTWLSQAPGAATGNITLGNTTIALGGTATSVGNLTLQNANIASVSPLLPNSLLANSSVTIGNTAVSLGSTVTSFGNVTMTNANIASGNVTVTTVSDQYGNVRAIGDVGSKTSAYTLVKADTGRYVTIGSGGSINITDNVFASGDVVSIFNNTNANANIVCTITTAYIAGTDSDKASVNVATRGVATVLFISNVACVIAGNVS